MIERTLLTLPGTLPLRGEFHLSPEGLREVTLSPSTDDAFHLIALGDEIPHLEQSLCDWVKKYCAGDHPPVDLPLAMPPFSPFHTAVLEALLDVPFGQRISYSSLAWRAGNPRAARAVGNALNRNPFPLLLPCHRIVRADGEMGGFGAGPQVKKILLDFEG